jgi:DNA-binding Lrp family transcriptional regulator
MLIEDGRANYSAIAKLTDITDVAVKKRIDSLKRRGVLTGVTANINFEALGFKHVLFLQIRAEPSKLKDITKRLGAIDYVTELYTMLGDFNLLVKLVVPDINQAEALMERIGTMDGVRELRSSAVLRHLKNSINLPSILSQHPL